VQLLVFFLIFLILFICEFAATTLMCHEQKMRIGVG
jgi:hypothetical protein